MKRRRFLTITAGTLAASATGLKAAPIRQWHGVALGADAMIALDRPDADHLIEISLAEIRRLERIFSLYRSDSELSQLNANGRIKAPSLDLIACLDICGDVHSVTDGLFDPTVQPLWAAYASAAASDTVPSASELARALDLSGWGRMRIDSGMIEMHPGMALTLNGIAQGFIADRVVDLLRSRGVGNVLVNTGEIHALGQGPDQRAWPVTLRHAGSLGLQDRALATSAPLGTVFDHAGSMGHILDPRTGKPAPTRWRQVSVSASSAAIADAISTAACLMDDRARIERTCDALNGARLEAAVRPAHSL